MKRVIVATRNQGKLSGVEAAFEQHGSRYGWNDFTIIGTEGVSGVAATPTSDELGLVGCENRINHARGAVPDGDLYIALEGVIATVKNRSFIRGWTMMYEVASERIVTASGASAEVPALIVNSIDADSEFNHVVRDIYPQDAIGSADLRNIGANGAFTRGEYKRLDSSYDGVRICLAMLANKSNWPEL